MKKLQKISKSEGNSCVAFVHMSIYPFMDLKIFLHISANPFYLKRQRSPTALEKISPRKLSRLLLLLDKGKSFLCQHN